MKPRTRWRDLTLVDWAYFVAAIALLVYVALLAWHTSNESAACEARGGVLVQRASGWTWNGGACVERRLP